MVIALAMLASLAPPSPALAQTTSAPAGPSLVSRFASWVSGAVAGTVAGTVAGWFTEDPKGEMRPAQEKITLPGRDGGPAPLKLEPVKEPGKRVKELTDQRTASSRTFELEDGRRQVEISPVRRHVRDESGTWQPVDTRVREHAEDGFTLAAERVGFVARFGERSDRLVRVGIGTAQATFGLPGEARTIKPEVDGAKVTYRGAFGEGVDLVYEVTASGVKESIVLARAPQGNPSYQFTVSMSGGLQAKANPDGSIGFVTPSGKGTVLTIPKPFMIDSADDAASPYGKRFSAAVTQTLGEQSTLTVIPDPGWLAAPERAWPVIIDPTVVIAPDGSTSSDAMIVSTSPTTNYDSDLRLSAGRSGTSVYRGLVQFNLTGAVPEGTTIDKAELGMYYDQTLAGSTGSVALEARRVTQPWAASTVTWSSINTAMGEVAATATFQAAQANIWHTYTITDLARAWVAGTTPNHGVMIKAANETVTAGGPQYAEGAWGAGFPENPMPKLTLTYGTPSVQLGRPLVVHATGAELAWKPYDGPGEVTEYQVHRSQDLSFIPSPATLVAPLDNQTTTYTDTSATPNTRVAYRVVAIRSAGEASTSGPVIVGLPNAGITVATLPPSADTTLTSCQPSTGHDKLGERANLSAGFGGTTFGTTRALLKFDTSVIPAGVQQASANLRIFQVAHRGLEPSYHFYPLTRSFDEATASWQQAASGVPWTKAGGDHETTSVGEGFWTSPTEPDFSSWWSPSGFDTLVQRWISDPSSNHGLLLRADSESTKACPTSGNGDSFTSSEAAEPEVRPWLVVYYYDPTLTYHAPATPSRMAGGEQRTIDVTITNTTSETWPAGSTRLGYFWKLPDGTDVTGGTQLFTPLPVDLEPRDTITVQAEVKAPALATGNLADAVSLVWDTQDTTTNNWKSASHHLPQLPQQIRLESPTSDLLGLEKFYAYTGKNTGAGGTALVNPYAGNVVWNYNAFSNPSRGAQTFVRMTYNSLDTSASSMGYGWSLQTSTLQRLGSQLHRHPPGQDWPEQVRLTDGDGTTHVWLRDPPTCTANCEYKHPRGVHLYLQKTGSADPLRQWVFTKPDRTQFFFDDEGFQSAIVDKNGNTMSFTYERRKSNNKPTKFLQYITDAAGRRTLTFDYHEKGQDYTYIDDASWQPVQATKLTNPHIIDTVESITDIAGRKVTFAYTDKGLMARMIDGAGDEQAKTFGFRYDATQGNKNVKLVTITDPRAHAETPDNPEQRATKLDYYDATEDPEDLWKAQTLTDRLNGVTTFGYVDPDGPSGAVVHATVTDPLEHQTRYVLDAYGRPDLITNANGEITDLEWDADHNVTTLIEKGRPDAGTEDAITTWKYDDKTGYPLEIKDAEANKNGTPPTTLTYAAPANFKGFVADLVSKTSPMGNRPEAGTDPRHHTWQFGYDDHGNLETVTDPLGVLTADPSDYTTTYTYDDVGQLATAADAKGNTTAYTDYHPTGYPQKITDALNNATTTEYDVRGNVRSVTDALGKITTQTYDIFKRPLESKVPKDQNASPPVLIVTPAPIYDRNDNVVKMTAPNGAVSTAAYDNADQLTASFLPKDTADAPERKATFTWDLAGNLKTQTEPKGHLPGADPAHYTTTYEYDPIYQLTGVITTDVPGSRQNKITYTYDDVGNVRYVIDPRKNATADTADYTAFYTYDLDHRVTKVKDAAGFETEVRYDLDGRVIEQEDQDDNIAYTDYNERDEVIRTRVPHAGTADGIKYVVTEFAYDEVGNRTKVITPRGVETTDDPADFIAETVYDKLNRPAEEIYPYDPDDPVYNTPDKVLYSYDPVSRLKEISHPPSHGQSIRNVTTMTYWDNGWSKTTTDPWDIKTTYDYNELGLQTNRTVTSAGGSSQRALDWSYYPDGKLKTHSDDGAPLGLDVVLNDNSDTGQVTTTGTWTLGTGGSSASNIVGPQSTAEGFVGYDYATAPAGTGQSAFTWNLTTPTDGTYKVQVQYPTGATATNAKYTVKHKDGEAGVTVDQTQNPGTWVELGSYTFTAGTAHSITLTDNANGTVAADAIKLVRDNTGESDTEKKDFTYTYDPNANLTKIEDKSPTAKIDVWDVAYTNLNQIDTIKEFLGGALKNTTSYAYNENSAVTTRTHDKTIATYGYDVRDLVSEVVNKKSATDTAPKTTRYTYTSRGERFTETKANGNTVAYDYFLSGVLRHSLEKKPNATVVSEHTIGYQGNLHRSSDHAKIQNADNPGAYLDHTYTYAYDPRDRIAKTVKTPTGGGPIENEIYWHDANSNVWEEEVLGKKTTFAYDRNRLMTSVTNGATTTYTYDPYGRLRTIQSGGKSQEKYTYDGFDHVTKHEKLGTDGATSTVTRYTYDPLDRTTSKTEKEGTANAKTTTYSYLGLSAEVLDEEVAGKLTKSFQYTPWGERLSQIKFNADNTEESSYYGYNSHTDVEQITKENGDTRATYGYTAYGKNDDKLFTGVDKPDPIDPTAKEEYNPYRFNAKRWDNSTGMYDMGFRNYNPGLNRYLNLDTYNGALDNLSLGLDPWTANRYSFTGGNPITNIELDGHRSDPKGAGNPARSAENAAPVQGESIPVKLDCAGSDSGASQGMGCGPPELNINAFEKTFVLWMWNWRNAVAGAAECASGKSMLACLEAMQDALFKRRIGVPDSTGKGATKKFDCHSFVPGTEVLMADGTRKPIEDVKVGDEVLATDPETGETRAERVTAIMTSKGDKDLVQISIDIDGDKGDARGSIIATDHHPFWVPILRKWVKADELQPGMWLRTSAGTYVQVEAIRKWTAIQRVHNMTVERLHTYYVLAGSAPVLVHNCDIGSIIDELPGRGKDDPTLGQVFKETDEGNQKIGAPFRSGYTDDADEINKYLLKSPYIDNPPNGKFGIVSHVETKLAWRMKNKKIKSMNVAINHRKGPCTGDFSCSRAVEAILPVGSTLTVWFKDPAGKVHKTVLRGKAPTE
ncbi:RHS repeat-associated protein [Nonomuraea polychroma]|uniref:RHS repeat-associated protein n=1 Tax=Nonomuraea polychroma TaxID=46176 RepID=A0A438M4P5_9ACTN|nr:DNRLRE domain-containing protein [Nonomuraea polychroma]RVX40557.1 RHS repeat-associated protein [Nonomuraea polychroma]